MIVTHVGQIVILHLMRYRQAVNESLDDLLERYEYMMKDGFEEDQRVSAAYANEEYRNWRGPLVRNL